jgi:hypothetical protein
MPTDMQQLDTGQRLELLLPQFDHGVGSGQPLLVEGVDVDRRIAELFAPTQLRAEHMRMAGRDHRHAAEAAHQSDDVVVEVAWRIPQQIALAGLHDE